MAKPKPPIYVKLHSEIVTLLKHGEKAIYIARQLGEREKLDYQQTNSLRVYVQRVRESLYHNQQQYGKEAAVITSDKKVSEFHWRSVVPHLKTFQTIVNDASSSQSEANWKIEADQICVAVIGDLQLGSWATDYELFMKVTDEILNTPNLYVILVGDLIQMAIKMRNVLEMMDNLIPPKIQFMFLDSWLNDIKHKVICSTWDNHAVMREEAMTGYSNYANIFSRHTIFHNHIGHIDISVGDITYKWAVTHFFRGKSMLNNVHAPMRYMRMEAPDRDIAVQGDFHLPGIAKYWEGGKEHCAAVCGSIQVDSGYAKRFFSLKTCPTYPCIALSGKEKIFTPYWSIQEWVNATNQSRSVKKR